MISNAAYACRATFHGGSCYSHRRTWAESTGMLKEDSIQHDFQEHFNILLYDNNTCTVCPVLNRMVLRSPEQDGPWNSSKGVSVAG